MTVIAALVRVLGVRPPRREVEQGQCEESGVTALVGQHACGDDWDDEEGQWGPFWTLWDLFA